MILLDTQALVWLLEDDPKLGLEARRIEADSDNVTVSAISFWEIGLLVSRKKIDLSLPIELWIERIEQAKSITIVAVNRAIAIDAGLLPHYDHGDPGDRIVLATARNLGCSVMTSDSRMLDYAKAGHVQAIDATR